MAAFEMGFVGTGNMGGALAQAACRSIAPEQVILSDRDGKKAAGLAKELGCNWGESERAAGESRFVILGVKPQVLAGVIAGLNPTLATRRDRFVIVSMAAGVSIAQIDAMLGADYPIIRIMPNIPAMAGQGMILCAANAQVTSEEMADFRRNFRAAGRIAPLEEKLIDAGSAISGCGPAYASMFIEALADGGVACGLSRADAMEFAAQMLLGTAQLILDTGRHPGNLKDAVCSPAGSTIAGVEALEQNGFRNACIQAVRAAYARTKELSPERK